MCDAPDLHGNPVTTSICLGMVKGHKKYRYEYSAYVFIVLYVLSQWVYK